MPSPLDTNLCRQLGNYVETLTHTGQKMLDKDILKKLKNICKISDGYVEHAYHLLIYQLEKAHAEIRFSAFQICDELFRRSHCFRELLVSNMQHVMELTCETSSDCPLPLPRSIALSLKRMALQCIQEWNKEYGYGYKKLQLGYRFLKHCKKVDFNALEIENSVEQVRRQEQERRQDQINQDRLKKVTTEINEMQPEISNTLTALENCMCLLLPTPEDFFIQDENETGTKPESSTYSSITKQVEAEKNTEEQDLDHKDRISELNESERKFEQNGNSVKIECDAPCIGRPKVDDDDDDDSIEEENSDFGSETSDSEEDIDFREYGILNSKYNIEVNVNTDLASVKETTDNAAIFENARDTYKLITNRFLPTVKKWIQVITKASGSSDQLKKILDLKNSLEEATKKYMELKHHTVASNSGDSSASDFEEVEEKDGYENTVSEDVLMPGVTTGTVCGIRKFDTKAGNQSGWNIWSEENSEMDPTSAQSTLSVLLKSMKPTMSKILEKENADSIVATCSKNEGALIRGSSRNTKANEEEPVPSTSKDNSVSMSEGSRKAKLLAVAPKLPFDIDLYHWEDNKVQAPTMLAVRAEGSRFWYTSLEELEEVPVPDGIPGLRTRVIEFTGKFEPVQWACRAPLPSGKLCPRRDRYKCPFHGPIVARDKTGKCTKPEDAENIAKEEEEKRKECPDWQDPQLLEDIKQATGVDLKMPEKKKGKGSKKKKQSDKSKYPGLTDIYAKQNTAYTRLSKKVFTRGAVKRVARAMDAADHKRFRDKYGDQFNYVYNTA